MKTETGKTQGFRFNGKVLFMALLVGIMSMSLYGCVKKNARPVSSKNILATVNGKNITVKELNAEINKYPPSMRAIFKTPKYSKKLVRTLVDKQLLLSDAVKKGIDKSNAYKLHVANFKKSLMIQLLLQKQITDKLHVTVADAKAYYKAHPFVFNLPLKINVSYIQSNSLKHARVAYNLLASGKPFADVARKLSNAKNAKSGGTMGWIKFNATTPAFNNAAFRIQKVGGYSGIVKVGKSFDIIRLNNRIAGKPKPFSSLSGSIMHMLKQQERSKVINNFIEQLSAKSNIKYFYNNLPTVKPAKVTEKNIKPVKK